MNNEWGTAGHEGYSGGASKIQRYPDGQASLRYDLQAL